MPAASPGSHLVHRAQRGERAALVELIERHQAHIYSLALALMRNPTDAADMTQETCVRLLRSLASFRGDDASFAPWLHRLTVNVCLDALRRRSRRGSPLSLDRQVGGDPDRPLLDVINPDRWEQPEWRLEREESDHEVQDALAQLPLPQRLALVLYYFEDSSYEQIAASMGLPLNTVKSHILRGKARMAGLLLGTAGRPRLELIAA